MGNSIPLKVGNFKPALTPGITAAGGAWNASIVAEIASWGGNTMVATGLGSFIAESTARGDWPAIVTSIATMSLIVVLWNRVFWRALYVKAEKMKGSTI